MEQTVDPKAYYGYLFEEDKQPTKLLDALLRGVANYIIENIGDKEDRCLSPPKLAAFYKAVGGNYDSLFVDVPDPTISYIYQTIGCQHTLQYTANDFAPPSIPALTARGFVRWESIETLLGPEEHVPFLQAAVRNFAIIHPDTGQRFPIDLPKEAFPLKPDRDVERWHKESAEKLRQQATPEEPDRPTTRPNLPPRQNTRSGYSHLKNPVSPGRPTRERQQGADYFSSRPLRHHVPGGDSTQPTNNRGSSYRPYLHPTDEAQESAHPRRRSFPENSYSPSPAATPPPVSADPAIPRPRPANHHRRHSHPRHRRQPSTSSSTSDSNVEPESTETSPTSTPGQPPKPHSTISPPTSPVTSSHAPSARRSRNLTVPYSHDRLATYKISIDPSGKLSAPFMRHAPQPQTSKYGRGGPVREGAMGEGSEFKRRGSWTNMAATVKDDDDDERVSNRDRDRKRREDGRPRLIQARSGSYDGRYVTRDSDPRRDRDRERDKERYSDRDEKELSDRRRERERKRAPSPVKGLDWRRYVPEILR